MAPLFESAFPGEPDSNYDESTTVEVYLADGTDDGQPIGLSVATYGDDAVIPDADIPRLITALYDYLASRGLQSPPGWVVLTNDVKDGPPKWEPGWDGAVHTDKAAADAELADCAAVGYQCILGEVRVAGS